MLHFYFYHCLFISLVQEKFFYRVFFVGFLKGKEWGRRASHGLLAFFAGVVFSLLPIYQQLFLFVNVPQQQVHCNSTTQIRSPEVFKFFHLELGDFGRALLGQETQILILRCPF